MRYYRIAESSDSRLVAQTDESAYDLTAARDGLRSYSDLASAATISNTSIDAIADELLPETTELERETVAENAARPVVPDEVWAAGVTYEISEKAREEESGKPEVYLDVYESDRPELFFKATPDRTVGPGDAVGVRTDSEWNVPEPELGIVLYYGTPVGYTIGNDVSSREIEGENPLYLPQAKVYDQSCSIGPCIVSADAVDDPHDLDMQMTVSRDGETIYEDETSTGNMVRSCEELVSYYTRHNTVPELSVLLTGTSLVPENGFTLKQGDEITITIDRIGSLVNQVVRV